MGTHTIKTNHEKYIKILRLALGLSVDICNRLRDSLGELNFSFLFLDRLKRKLHEKKQEMTTYSLI